VFQLTFTLHHVGFGSAQFLLDKPVNSAALTCGNNFINGTYRFTSDATTTIQDICNISRDSDIPPGDYIPTLPDDATDSEMSRFWNGQDVSGTWRLFISDSGGGLVSNANWTWRLDITLGDCPDTFAFNFSGSQYAKCFRDVQRGEQIDAGLEGSTNALVFTGAAGSGGATWLTVYDATPLTSEPGPTYGLQTLCADVLVHRFNNVKGAGVVALLNEGPDKRGLALIVSDAGNTDMLRLSTVEGDPARKGKLHTLTSVSLNGGIALNTWYRLVMTVDPAPPPGKPTVTGQVFKHAEPSDPSSDLGAQVGSTLEFNEPLPEGVSSLGESGIIAQAVSAVVDLSVTNFTNDDRCARRQVPE